MRSLTSAYTQGANSEMGNGGSPAETAERCSPSLSIMVGQTACLPGVGTVASGTQWRISASAVPERSTHPTHKPIALVRWLATLLLPPAEYAPRRILVPFAGSGSEMIGCGLAGWDEIVGVELMPEYADIAEARLAYWLQEPVQLPLIAEAGP